MRMFPGNEKTLGHYGINYISHVFEMHVYEQIQQGFLVYRLLPFSSQGCALLPGRMCAGVAAVPPP
jgi:hypothetical protein